MRIRLASLLIGALLFLTAPAWGIASDVSGTWSCTVALENGPGDMKETLVLKQDGEKLTGTHSGVFGDQKGTGTIKGDKVVFTVDGKTQKGQPFTLTYTGTLESPTKLTGTVVHAKGPGTWTAVKSK